MNNLMMHDPDLLYVLIQEYFQLVKKEKKHPTIPGLALAICFNRTNDIIMALKKWEAEDSAYPERALEYLVSAITRIEDHYLQEGLTAKIPAALTKFCLGAYHQVQEPSRNEQQGASNAIQIVFEAPEEQHKFPTITNVNQLSAPDSGNKISSDSFEMEFKEVM